jgi:hypothetical protein
VRWRARRPAERVTKKTSGRPCASLDNSGNMNGEVECKHDSQKKTNNAWPSGYTPNTKVQDVFDVPSCIAAAIKNASLLQALGFSSGSCARASPPC